MARSITNYFATITTEEYRAQVASSPREGSSIAPLQPQKRPVGRPRKSSANDLEKGDRRSDCPRIRLANDSEQENEPIRSVRRQYTCKQKARVVEYARHHGARAAARQFNIARKNIQRWLKESKDSNSLFQSARPSKRRRVHNGGRHKAGRKLSYPKEVDEKLLEWLLCMRERHLCVSTQMLRDKAKAAITQHNASFQASEGWLRKFMRRHSIVLRAKTSVAQKLPKDLDSKIEAFYKEVQDQREDGKYSKEMIGNMDETPLYFDMIPSRSLERKGAKEVRVKSTGAQKRHITVVLACTGAGKMLHQSKAWMDGSLMQRWVKEIWLKYTEKKKSLLVFDTFKAHFTEEVRLHFLLVYCLIEHIHNYRL